MMQKKSSPMQQALASRRGKGIDLTITIEGPQEPGNDLEAPGSPEEEGPAHEMAESPMAESDEMAKGDMDEMSGEDPLIAGLSPQERERIMMNPQGLKERVLKQALERAKG